MTTHTIISGYDNDKINNFYIENNFISVVKKEDFNAFKKLHIYNNAGVCILISDEKTSIKKISTSVFDYIDQYCSQNTWWKTLVFIGNVDNNISNIELSYIEQLLTDKVPKIESKIHEGCVEYENDIELDVAQKIQSNKIVELIIWVINSYTALNLFKNDEKENQKEFSHKKEDDTLNINAPSEVLKTKMNKTENPSIIFDSVPFSAPSMRQLLVKFVTYLIMEGHSKEMIKNFYDSPIPSASKFLGTKHKFGSSGDQLTDKIIGTDLVMYSRYSSSGMRRTLNNIAEALKKSIRINI